MRRIRPTSEDPKTLRAAPIFPVIDQNQVIQELLVNGHSHSNFNYLETLSDPYIDQISDVSADDAVEELFEQPQQW